MQEKTDKQDRLMFDADRPPSPPPPPTGAIPSNPPSASPAVPASGASEVTAPKAPAPEPPVSPFGVPLFDALFATAAKHLDQAERIAAARIDQAQRVSSSRFELLAKVEQIADARLERAELLATARLERVDQQIEQFLSVARQTAETRLAQADHAAAKILQVAEAASAASLQQAQNALQMAEQVEKLSKKLAEPLAPRMTGMEALSTFLTQLLKTGESIGTAALTRNPGIGKALEDILRGAKASLGPAAAENPAGQEAPSTVATAAPADREREAATDAKSPPAASGGEDPLMNLDLPLGNLSQEQLKAFCVEKYGVADLKRLTVRDLAGLALEHGAKGTANAEGTS